MKLLLPVLPPESRLDALVAQYRQSGRSHNTERTYKSHVDHYRYTWGGLLPANADSICKYLVSYATTLKISTLRQRLSALSKWHIEQGFNDPTQYGSVTETIKGIAKQHQGETKQAYPLTFRHVRAICERLESEKKEAILSGDNGAILRTHRDLALLLIGFWQAFRSDELSRVAVENVKASRKGITIFLSHSKTDRDAEGRKYSMPSLKAFCPASAYIDWIQVSGIREGLVFRSINRWGHLAVKGIHRQSIEHILNRVAGDLFPGEKRFSTHSLRHGFADWAVHEGWDLKSLMDHVGWLSADNARKYMPARKNFGTLALADVAGSVSDEAWALGDGATIIGNCQAIDDTE
jgi:site-specific recombinase XerD